MQVTEVRGVSSHHFFPAFFILTFDQAEVSQLRESVQQGARTVAQLEREYQRTATQLVVGKVGGGLLCCQIFLLLIITSTFFSPLFSLPERGGLA